MLLFSLLPRVELSGWKGDVTPGRFSDLGVLAVALGWLEPKMGETTSKCCL